jgi:hypothetical protein
LHISLINLLGCLNSIKQNKIFSRNEQELFIFWMFSLDSVAFWVLFPSSAAFWRKLSFSKKNPSAMMGFFLIF